MPTNMVYPLPSGTIPIAASSLLMVLLCLAPFCWFLQRSTVASASLIFWIMVVNAMTFVNAVLWPRDNVSEWWSGVGLCDVEVRLKSAAPAAFMGASVCILQNLAECLSPRSLSLSSAGKKRKLIREVLQCHGLPVFIIAVFYVVQYRRYDILTIQGCSSYISASWVSFFLIVMWTPLLALVASGYAILVLTRLRKHRMTMSTLLRNSNTTRTNFFRLLLLSGTTVFLTLPLVLWQLLSSIIGAGPSDFSFDWSEVHDPENWGIVYRVPLSKQEHPWTPWFGIVSGFLMILFVGTGSDAVRRYEAYLASAHLTWISRGISSVKAKISATRPYRLLSSCNTHIGLMASRASSCFRRHTIPIGLNTMTSLDVPVMLDTIRPASPIIDPQGIDIPAAPKSTFRRICDRVRTFPQMFRQSRKQKQDIEQQIRQGSVAPLITNSKPRKEDADVISPASHISFALPQHGEQHV